MIVLQCKGRPERDPLTKSGWLIYRSNEVESTRRKRRRTRANKQIEIGSTDIQYCCIGDSAKMQNWMVLDHPSIFCCRVCLSLSLSHICPDPAPDDVWFRHGVYGFLYRHVSGSRTAVRPMMKVGEAGRIPRIVTGRSKEGFERKCWSCCCSLFFIALQQVAAVDCHQLICLL